MKARPGDRSQPEEHRAEAKWARKGVGVIMQAIGFFYTRLLQEEWLGGAHVLERPA